MERSINWGIIGPGKIAHKFADGLSHTPGCTLAAIASRDKQRGKDFALKFKVPTVYDHYEELIDDPAIDIIYIATPHTFHHQQTLLCLRGKKPVLCEKPFSIHQKNVVEMVAAARENQTFLMEGMWSRFFPAIQKVTALIAQNAIGAIRFVRADFGFAAPHDPQNRVLNISLGGGAQLDVGVYPLFLVLLLLGKPQTIQATSKLASTGADETTAVQFNFENGAIAHILSSIGADTSKQAEIVGSTGSITMHTPWHKSQLITVRQNTGETTSFDFPFTGFGFEYEIMAVNDALRKEKKESELMSLDFSLLLAGVADEILRQAGVIYPPTI